MGAAFLLVGIAGFIPGLTSNYDELELAGPESGAKLFGLSLGTRLARDRAATG